MMKPCPFCGSENLDDMQSWSLARDNPIPVIVCVDCGVEGPYGGNTRAEATQLWNKRAHLTLKDHAAQLAAIGAKPDPKRTRENTIDRDVCRDVECPACQRKGMQFQAFANIETWFGVMYCPQCYAAEQF